MNSVAPQSAASTSSPIAPIADDLQHVEVILRQTLESSRPGVEGLIRHLEQYRGKRLRPTLLLLTAHACGCVTPSHHILGAVVEMIHTATLVHDDVLDAADTRRHVPTVNSQWGNQTSILLGDYLFTHAFHLTSTIGDARACEIIGEATNRVCEGELHQVCRRGELSLSESEYLDIVDAKTAELTSCCCRLGAKYAGADDDIVESLARYGRCLGTAFQIADDLLDLVGKERTTGKSLGTDLEQQKLTLPVIHLLQHTSEKTRNDIHHVLRNGHADKRRLLQPYLQESGSLNYARDRAADFARQARAELQCLPPTECQEVLELLTERVVNRDR